MNVLPEESVYSAQTDESLPLARDWAIDTNTGRMLYQNGRQYMVDGLEAVRVWIWKALHTERAAGDVYGGVFGRDFEDLTGAGVNEAVQDTLAERIADCLTASPYIPAVDGFTFAYTETTLSTNFTVHTVYGDVNTEVSVHEHL